VGRKEEGLLPLKIVVPNRISVTDMGKNFYFFSSASVDINSATSPSSLPHPVINNKTNLETTAVPYFSVLAGYIGANRRAPATSH
jgi:hypothetical protein